MEFKQKVISPNYFGYSELEYTSVINFLFDFNQFWNFRSHDLYYSYDVICDSWPYKTIKCR